MTFVILALIGGPLLAVLLQPLLCDVLGAMCGGHGVNHLLLTIALWGCFFAAYGAREAVRQFRNGADADDTPVG